ncbi:hypothetical protein PHYPSEUDO_002177 [Phytophthora pseudosyringae]|uniref:CRN domain-containing protein-containing protein n=1 Tax=Phytophthora pseudosyringae TaxID=221518 RepID=A0A8T1VTU1_9STRA|nr:hypothetical protein PHYPSEUDO_002177 [Phytophthora pseudosyringae]
MSRKWFQLVGEDGSAVTPATSVVVEPKDVDTFREAVFAKVSRALPANVIAADLTVFADRAAYDANQALDPRASLVGIDEKETCIVQVLQRTEVDPRYFILPEVQEQVEKAVFVILEGDEDHKGVGMGVFVSPTLATTT